MGSYDEDGETHPAMEEWGKRPTETDEEDEEDEEEGEEEGEDETEEEHEEQGEQDAESFPVAEEEAVVQPNNVISDSELNSLMRRFEAPPSFDSVGHGGGYWSQGLGPCSAALAAQARLADARLRIEQLEGIVSDQAAAARQIWIVILSLPRNERMNVMLKALWMAVAALIVLVVALLLRGL